MTTDSEIAVPWIGNPEQLSELAAGLENAARVSWRWAQSRPAERDQQLRAAQNLANTAREIRAALEQENDRG